MGRSWFIPHWRRIVMQVMLWLVFGLSMGLAVLVSYEKHRALRVPLRDPESIGRLRVSLPLSWSPAAKTQGATEPGDVVYVEEQTSGSATGPNRHLTIRRLRTGTLHDAPLSSLEFLFRADMLSERDLPPAVPRAESPVIQSIEIAGWPGKLITQTTINGASRPVVKKSLVACATLPNSQSLVIKLNGDGQPDAADEELVRQMAETISVKDIAPPEDCGGVVSLPGGMVVNVPKGYAMLSARDSSRTSRELVATTEADPWTAIELVPCTWFPEDGEEAFLSLLAVRDREWKPGPVKKIGPNIWMTQRSDNQSFPSRAYLTSNGTDQALLVILRGSYRDGSGFESAWSAISSSVKFAAVRDLATSLDTGAQAARSMREQGIDQVISPPVGRQTWLLWDQAENLDQRHWMVVDWHLKSIGATPPADNTEVEEPSIWAGRRQTLPVDPFGGTPEWLVDWSGSSDQQKYTSRGSATGARRGQASIPLWPTGQIDVTEETIRFTKPQAASMPRPEQYVPGGWLPMLLWPLTENQGPMVIRTESFVGYDGLSLRGLLTLTIARSRSDGMDCVSVHVNGSGQTSRWYYNTDEPNALRYVDLTASLRAQQSGDPGRDVSIPKPD